MRTFLGHVVAATVLAATAIFLLVMCFNSDRADAASGSPRPGHPVVQIDGAHREVNQIKTVYVEMIVAPGAKAPGNPGYSYVQYNNGASQLVRNCNRPNMYSCVDPTTGTVGLDDGSFVYLARWAK